MVFVDVEAYARTHFIFQVFANGAENRVRN